MRLHITEEWLRSHCSDDEPGGLMACSPELYRLITDKEQHMSTSMRAKLQVGFVQEQFYGPDKSKSGEVLTMHAVCANSYSADGSDEDNTYAKFSPSANLQLSIANPALWGGFAVGEKYYVDFTPAPAPV